MDYVLNLTQQELQVIFMGLGELPIKVGVNLLGKIQNQVSEQDSKNAVELSKLGVSES